MHANRASPTNPTRFAVSSTPSASKLAPLSTAPTGEVALIPDEAASSGECGFLCHRRHGHFFLRSWATIFLCALFYILSTSSGRADLVLTSSGIADGFGLSTFASDIPNNGSYGPMGVATTSAGNVLVTDFGGSPPSTYSFSDTGGQTPVTARAQSNVGTPLFGITNAGGNVYAVDFGNGNLVSLNNNGSVRSVLDNIGINSLGEGITTDPLNQHILVDAPTGILDINPKTNQIRTVNNQVGDGLSVSSDGETVYLAQGGAINGYNAATGRQVYGSGPITGTADGVGIMQGASKFTGDLIVNTNGGNVWMVDPTTGAQSEIASGGSRGDFVGYDTTNGSLFVTQTSSVDRLTCGVNCFFQVHPPHLIINPVPSNSWTKLKTSDPTTYRDATKALNTVIKEFETEFTNPVTVNIKFGWNTIDGQKDVNTGETGYPQPFKTAKAAQYTLGAAESLMRAAASNQPGNSALNAGVNDSPCLSSTKACPYSSNSKFFITDAQYLALTGTSQNSDSVNAYVGFGTENGSYPFAFNPSSSNPPAHNQEDFNAVAEHEIAHALGRFDSAYLKKIVGARPYLTPLDFYKYDCTSSNTLDPNFVKTCFSNTGGKPYASHGQPGAGTFSDTSDSSDWFNVSRNKCIGSDSFDYCRPPGTLAALSSLDLTEMNALGWDPVPTQVVAVSGGPACAPHPLLGIGLFGKIQSAIFGSTPGEFYSFHWGGGIFHASTKIAGTDPASSFDFELFNPRCHPLDQATADAGNDFRAEITDVLPISDYTIGLFGDPQIDPNFTITFVTPVQGVSKVPEPSSAALLLSGLVALAAVLIAGRRRYRWPLTNSA